MSAPEIDAYLAILTGTVPSTQEAEELARRDQQKQLATCQARAALRGIVLVESHDDRGRPEWIASQYAMTKAFSSLKDVSAWLGRIEGTR